MTIQKLLILMLIASVIFIIGIEIGMADEVDLTIEGHFGGLTNAAEVSGSYAYIGQGQDFVVININNPTTPFEFSRLTTSGLIRDIKILNNYAYVADHDNGLVIVDISDPLTPYLAGHYDTIGDALDIAVSGSYAYVADGSNGLVVVDISDPSTPYLAGHYNTVGVALDIAVSGSYAYVADHDNGLVIVDISDPSTPYLAGHYNTVGVALDIAVSGSYAYVADRYNGLVIVDISDPSTPYLAGHYNTIGYACGIAVSGSYAYVADWNHGLVIVDISDPSVPHLAGHYNTVGYALDIAVSGSYAYVADGYNGLVIVDISDPSTPYLAGHYDTIGYACGIAVSGSYAYAADRYNGLVIVDISDPSTPYLAGHYDTVGDAYGIAVSGSYAYVADGNYGLVIVDISDPSVPHLAGHYNTVGDAYGIAVSGSYAYVADYKNGLVIVDISDPSTPYLVGHYDTVGDAYGIAVSGSYAYVADYKNGLVIVDISDPLTPYLAGHYDTIGYALDIAVSGSYAYVADGSNGLVIVDISDPSTPYLAGHYDTIGYAYGIAVSGSYAYVADGDNGLVIIDISDPSTPHLAGHYDTIGDALDIAVSGSYAYVADWGNGVVILRTDASSTGPQDRTLLQVEGHSEVYWLQNNKLYWVTDWDVINNMAGVPGWESVNTLPVSEFDPAAYTQGPRFITTGVESDGLLIREVGDYKVYRIENGEKRHITYPDVMDLKGYSFDDVIKVSANILDMFPLGDPIGIEVDLYFNKVTNSGEESHVCQFTTGETTKIYTETTVIENYDVETYVRLTYPDGTTKKYAYHESSDFSPTDPLQFSETERPLYPGIWHAQTKIWNWNEYTFTGNEDEGIYTWEFWYKDVASGKILGKDVQGYEFSITPPDPIDNTPPIITILPIVGISPDGITFYNSNVYISGTAFDPSGIKSLTLNGQELWSIPVYGVKVFGSIINLKEGVNEITISAIDNSENSNEKIENININYYPFNVKINSPTDGSIFKEGDSIKLEGKVTGGTPQFDYEWLIDGVLENFGTSNNGLIEHTLNGFALGEYKVRLRVTDFKGYVFETNEIKIFVKPPKPDLIVTDISFSKDNQEIKEAAEGEQITVTAGIKNVGPVDAQGEMWVYLWQVSHYDNFEPDENGSKAIITYRSGSGLASGEEAEVIATWNVAPVFTNQYGFVQVEVDAQTQINEIDENNNKKLEKVSITSRSNFWPEKKGYHLNNFIPSTSEKKDMMFNVNTWFDLTANPLGTVIDFQSIMGSSLCYGMSATSILYYDGRLIKPVDKEVFDMLKTDNDVISNILRYQAMQTPDLAGNLLKMILIDKVDIENEYNLIENSVRNGRPIISHIRYYDQSGKGVANHAVVAYGTYSSPEKIKNVLVYDPNHPGMARVIKFNFESNTIEYEDFLNNNLLTAKYLSTKTPLLSISDGKNVLDVIIKEFNEAITENLFESSSKLFIFQCPINILITDQYGRIIDDNGNNEIPGAKVKIDGDLKIFYVPRGLSYTIHIDAYDSGDFTFTQINPLTNEYASVISFVDIPTTENTKAIFEVSSTNPEYMIEIDYDGDGSTDEMREPDIIDKIGVNYYNITFLPPITTMDQFNLTDGSTLPIKFTARNSTTDEFIYDDTVNVTITNSTGHLITYFTNGTGTDSVRINSEEEQYIVNFRTRDYNLITGETYTVTVTFGEADSLRGYEITYFTLIEGGKAKGRPST